MFEFELPDVGEGVAEGELVAWHVAPGDHVEEDEVLAEVETDKAVVDLPSPVAGTVRELRAEEGDVVPVGDIVVTIDVDGDVPDDAETTDEASAAEKPAASEESSTAEEASVNESGTDEPSTGEPSTEGLKSDESESDGAAAGGGRVFAPPNVRRLARELGVDIAGIDGSDLGGRVTESDVREAAAGDETNDEAKAETGEDSGPKSAVSKSGGETKAAVSKPSKGTVSAVSGADKSAHEGKGGAERDRTLAAPSTRRIADEAGVDIDSVPTEKTRDGEAFVEPEDVRVYADARQAAQRAEREAVSDTGEAGVAAATGEAVTASVTTADGEVTREPYRGIRRTIGQRMEQSVYTAPHVTHHDTAVVDDLVATRADLQPRAEEQGVSLTYLPFVMKAIVAGLQEFPVLNTTLDEESGEIVYKHFYNMGVAVATDDGLLVPVVENVDEKGLGQLASEITDLTERARDRDLTREEMQGGTFTITNFGAIGGEYATPIINYPETAILGLGSIEQRPVVREGEVVPAHTLPLSLSIDHRVIDGAEAARFVNTVIEYLENPNLLLLE